MCSLCRAISSPKPSEEVVEVTSTRLRPPNMENASMDSSNMKPSPSRSKNKGRAHGGDGSDRAALSRSVESNKSNESNRSGRGSARNDDISEIDKRILALRSYLDNARSGILDDK
jgi:hypothetical protein